MHPHQQIILDALTHLGADDLFTACRAFQKNPDKPNGLNPETVIDDYLDKHRKIDAATAWIKAQSTTLDCPLDNYPWTDEQQLQLTRARFWLTEIWQQLVQAIRVASPVLCDEDHIKEFTANIAQRMLVNPTDPQAVERRWRIDHLIIKELADCFPSPALSLSHSSPMTTH